MNIELLESQLSRYVVSKYLTEGLFNTVPNEVVEYGNGFGLVKRMSETIELDKIILNKERHASEILSSLGWDEIDPDSLSASQVFNAAVMRGMIETAQRLDKRVGRDLWHGNPDDNNPEFYSFYRAPLGLDKQVKNIRPCENSSIALELATNVAMDSELLMVHPRYIFPDSTNAIIDNNVHSIYILPKIVVEFLGISPYLPSDEVFWTDKRRYWWLVEISKWDAAITCAVMARVELLKPGLAVKFTWPDDEFLRGGCEE